MDVNLIEVLNIDKHKFVKAKRGSFTTFIILKVNLSLYLEGKRASSLWADEIAVSKNGTRTMKRNISVGNIRIFLIFSIPLKNFNRNLLLQNEFLLLIVMK